MIEANLWWAAWVIKEVSFYSTYPFIAFLLCSFLPFPPAELLSACHELRCRYGCVMTRNGTFCFCADGFEVGEDGTSCRGRILHRWWGPPAMERFPLFLPPLRTSLSFCPQPDFFQLNKQELLPIWEPSACRHGLVHSTDTRLHIYPYTCIQILHAFFMFFMVCGTGHDFATVALNYLNPAHNLCVQLHNYGK